MKQFARHILLFVFVFSLLAVFVHADTSSVNVPDHCTVVDSDGASHNYGPGQYLGICALQAAIDASDVSGVSFSNAFPSLGLFVTKVNGVTADPSSQYWALYQNGNFASLGLSQLPVAAGDTITLELHDFSDNFLGSRLTLKVGSLVVMPAPLSATPASSGGGGLTLHDPFDVTRAVMYLGSVEKNGSFGSPLLDDWVAIMTGTGKAGDIKSHLTRSFLEHAPVLSGVTDFERHVMALEALGIDPYAGTSVDYVSPIVRAFDGTQIGDHALVNDDIFAIFPLMHAGYAPNDEIVRKTIAFIISNQQKDGSWGGSVDLTAAAIQALQMTGQLPGTTDSIQRATQYLHAAQSTDGGFGNSSATSWALQAISALGQSAYDWDASTYQTPDYYLSTKQQTDGGVEAENADTATRVWATAYAIPAAERKPWDSLLGNFPKPAPIVPNSTGTTTTDMTASSSEATTTLAGPAMPAVEETSYPKHESAAVAPSASVDPGVRPDEPTATSEVTQAAAAGAVAGSSSDPVNFLWGFGLVLVLGFMFFNFAWNRR